MSESEKNFTFQSQIKLCAFVFTVVLLATGLMVWTSFLPHDHYSWTFKMSWILVIAAVNAFFVAGFLMHLLSEKKLVYTVLAFTVFFVIGLAGLTLWAMNDFPVGTAVH
jgi:heme/copper-type cytochrome/quinol oxidase subunit 4